MTSTSQTLGDRIASGRIPVGEALRIGMQLADQLRRLHDQGIVHGALSPSTIAMAGNSVEILLPPDDGSAAGLYSAPEIAAGSPPDARSDIFSFGAIFYELLTGRPVFEDGSTTPLPSGSPAVDRLVGACVANAPEARYQRVQKLMLELRLLASAARRGSPSPMSISIAVQEPIAVSAPAPTAAPPAPPAAVPGGGMSEFERRITARLEEQERSVSSVAQVATELLQALREQQRPVPAPPPPASAPMPGYAPSPRLHARSFSAPLDGYSSDRIGQAIDALADRVSRLDLVVSSAVERLQKLEENLDAFDTDAAALRDSVTRDIRNFERALKAQGTAIESARTAMGQTDDLVERVVEALDSLQSMFVNTSDERSLAS